MWGRAWVYDCYYEIIQQYQYIARYIGGRSEIRTHGGLAPTAVFKTAALNHSAILPQCRCFARSSGPRPAWRSRRTLLLRDPRPVASPPAKLRRRLQLRQAAQNPQGPHPIRVYRQSLDFRASQIQNQPAPANAGTKHLVRNYARERPDVDCWYICWYCLDSTRKNIKSLRALSC